MGRAAPPNGSTLSRPMLSMVSRSAPLCRPRHRLSRRFRGDLHCGPRRRQPSQTVRVLARVRVPEPSAVAETPRAAR